jgi:SAM-dependent methyltransferase
MMRNDGLCIWCSSGSRNRHVAKCILEEFKNKNIKSLSEFRGRDNISVYNTSSQGPIARIMGISKNIITSEFIDDCPLGRMSDGVLCQNLENLTFPDERFDLIISEDVFEHVKDYRRGFSEVYRVLKKNGLHIFSIPFYFDKKTEELFSLNHGKYELREPIEYHGDPIRGKIPAYTHFGYDLFDLLQDIGFNARISVSQYADEKKYATFNSYTFITRK